jgi:hypothetical protein
MLLAGTHTPWVVTPGSQAGLEEAGGSPAHPIFLSLLLTLVLSSNASCRHAHTVGGDASQAGLEEARGEYHNRLRGHIVRPLEQWSEGMHAVEVRAVPPAVWLLPGWLYWHAVVAASSAVVADGQGPGKSIVRS